MNAEQKLFILILLYAAGYILMVYLSVSLMSIYFTGDKYGEMKPLFYGTCFSGLYFLVSAYTVLGYEDAEAH